MATAKSSLGRAGLWAAMVLLAGTGEGCFHRLDVERIPCDPANATSCPGSHVCTQIAEGYRCRRPTDASLDLVPATGETGQPIDATATGEAGRTDGKAIDVTEAGGGEVSGTTRLDADLDGTRDVPIGMGDGGRLDVLGTVGSDAPLTPPADGGADVPQSPGIDGAAGADGVVGSGGVGGTGGTSATGGTTGTGGARTNGSPCLTGTDCDSGNCADGVCCDGTCGGCNACLQTMTGKSDGTCAPVLAGVDPHELCADETPTNQCGSDGACDGKGFCRKVGTNHICTPGLCNTGTFTPASTCDGLGACKTVIPVVCGASPCSPTDGCQTTCTTDANCVGDSYCDSTKVCKAKKNDGDSCAEGLECSSTFCIDGVCCHTTCGGCNACANALTGQASGTCAAAKITTDPHDACAVGTPPCGQDGNCDGAGACSVAPPTTPCGAESCTGNLYTPAAKCTGTGTCGTVSSGPCAGNLLCGGTTCKTTCGSNADCVSGFACPVGGGSACGTACGDGTVNGSDQCDDGNITPGDGCNASCQTEPGWTCTGSGPGSCVPTCGDGIRVGTEQCDDGNAVTTDGCNACVLSPGWACEGSPSVCVRVVYVNSAATGANDGTSWTDAYTSLATALAAATVGKEVWIAQGVYRPSSKTDSFVLKGDVPVYGGFLGSSLETRAARDWKAHATVLSGDLNGDDDERFTNVSDNSRGVLTARTTGNLTLDGVYVRGGVGAGESGGLMVSTLSVANEVTIRNCVFEVNSGEFGGALRVSANKVLLVGSIFRNNRAVDSAATAAVGGIAGAASVGTQNQCRVEDCLFEGNVAETDNSALSVSTPETFGRSPLVLRTVFRNNTGNSALKISGNAHVVHCRFSGNVGTSSPAMNAAGGYVTVTNTLFVGHTATDSLKGATIADSTYARMRLVNVTVASSVGRCTVYNSNGVDAVNSILAQPLTYDGTGSAYYSMAPMSLRGTGNIVADPLLDPATGVPGSNSPVINAGSNAYLDYSPDVADIDNDGNTTEPLPFDLAGNARVQGDAIDIGAYEVR